MKHDNPELEAVYRTLSEKYGQTMTMQDACRELHVQTPRARASGFVHTVSPGSWLPGPSERRPPCRRSFSWPAMPTTRPPA